MNLSYSRISLVLLDSTIQILSGYAVGIAKLKWLRDWRNFGNHCTEGFNSSESAKR